MPTYQYACNACGHELEAVQSFSDDALTTCPECGGALRKLFGNVGVVFKGSGFYRNDSRKSDSAASSGTASSGTGESATKKSDASGSAATTTATTSSASTNPSTSTP